MMSMKSEVIEPMVKVEPQQPITSGPSVMDSDQKNVIESVHVPK
jgi:hypothetical protein